MTKLSKSQIQEATNIYLLANTPKSMLRAMLKSSAVDKLRRDCSPEDLLEYYNRITTKAKRSPFIVALAYATLIALLVKSPSNDQYPDPTFLQWGSVIESHLKQQFGSTSSVIIMPNTPQPTVRLVSLTGMPLSNSTITRNKPLTQILS
jgi:hypothetical protein